MPRVALIGGCARAGTTALWRVITGDPAAVISLERYVVLARTRPADFTPGLFEKERFYDVRPGDTFYSRLDDFPYNAESRDRFDAARVVGDKIPLVHLVYRELLDFEDARVVFILRNVVDVAESYEHRAQDVDDPSWRRTRDHRVAVREWNASVDRTLEWRERLPIHVVDYESFFAGLADMDALATFLGLDSPALEVSYARELDRRPEVARASRLTALQRQHVVAHAQTAQYHELLRHAVRRPGYPPASRQAFLFPKYQDADEEVLSYDYWQASTGKWFRGPRVENPRIVSLGAASTFGRLVRKPYPALLSERLGMPVANLGFGGARAPYFSQDRQVLEVVNSSDMAVIEVFSARGTGTSRVSVRDHASALLRLRGSEEPFTFADTFYDRLLHEWSPIELQELRSEILQVYVSEMRDLLDRVHVPKVLLWFSRRTPEQDLDTTSVEAFMGDFPHFVDRETLRDLSTSVDALVEVVSSEGSPYIVRNARGEPAAVFDGPHKTENAYYPSQEMHRIAAETLDPIIRSMLE